MAGKRNRTSSQWETPQHEEINKNERCRNAEERDHHGHDSRILLGSQQYSILSCSNNEEQSEDNEEEQKHFFQTQTQSRGEESCRVSVHQDDDDHERSINPDMSVTEGTSAIGGRIDDVAAAFNSTPHGAPTSTPPTRLPVGNFANIVSVYDRDDTPARQPEPPPHFDNTLALLDDDYSVGVWMLAIRDNARNNVFYLKQFAEEGSEYGSTFQKLLCSQARVPVEVQARFWDSRGRKTAKQSLNEKRKTIIGSMKREFLSKFDGNAIYDCDEFSDITQQLVIVVFHIAETVEDREKKHMLHHPKLLTGWLNPDYQNDLPETTPVLRDTDAYKDFLFLFGRFGVKTENFKTRYKNSLLSSFVSCNMEAFLVTVYTLNYNFWLQKTNLEEDGERASAEKTQLLVRGSRDNGGWSDPAIIMYGRIIRHIREQRRKDWSFDQKLQQEWIKENGGNSSTPGRNSNQKCPEYRLATGEADLDFEENCERNHEYSQLLVPHLGSRRKKREPNSKPNNGKKYHN